LLLHLSYVQIPSSASNFQASSGNGKAIPVTGRGGP
jgi:hypothetical protein